MILESELAAVIAKQREIELKKSDGQIRPLDFNDILLGSHALDITGVRRCGKSTVMHQRIRSGKAPWFYVNFESPLLTQFEMRDTIRLDALIGKSGARRLFFDEVDQFAGWEKYVRQKLDEGFHVCISGSNASLLEGELGTKLTGRHISKELFPFSYAEYLKFTKTRPGVKSVQGYALDGGFPRYLQTKEEIVLQELFDDIVYRDVIVHNKIRDVNAVRELAAYLVENMVYLALRRKTGDISYFDDDGECDFITRDRHTVTAAVQACIKLTDEDKDREIEGLRKAMETFDLPSGTIVTEDQRDRLTFGARHIDVIPFWDWAL